MSRIASLLRKQGPRGDCPHPDNVSIEAPPRTWARSAPPGMETSVGRPYVRPVFLNNYLMCPRILAALLGRSLGEDGVEARLIPAYVLACERRKVHGTFSWAISPFPHTALRNTPQCRCCHPWGVPGYLFYPESEAQLQLILGSTGPYKQVLRDVLCILPAIKQNHSPELTRCQVVPALTTTFCDDINLLGDLVSTNGDPTQYSYDLWCRWYRKYECGNSGKTIAYFLADCFYWQWYNERHGDGSA